MQRSCRLFPSSALGTSRNLDSLPKPPPASSSRVRLDPTPNAGSQSPRARCHKANEEAAEPSPSSVAHPRRLPLPTGRRRAANETGRQHPFAGAKSCPSTSSNHRTQRQEEATAAAGKRKPHHCASAHAACAARSTTAAFIRHLSLPFQDPVSLPPTSSSSSSVRGASVVATTTFAFQGHAAAAAAGSHPEPPASWLAGGSGVAKVERRERHHTRTGGKGRHAPEPERDSTPTHAESARPLLPSPETDSPGTRRGTTRSGPRRGRRS
jgi:hypothetical protein